MKFDNDKPRVTLTKPELEALVMCASKDPAAINLYAVHIDPSARTLAAADGHMLILGTEMGTERVDIGGAVYTTKSVALPPAHGSAITISAKHIAAWLRFAPKGDSEIVLEWDDKTVTALIAEQKLEAPRHTVKFPPWRKVLPKKPTDAAKVPHMIGLGAALASRALDALQKVAMHSARTCVAWNLNGDPLDEHRGPECHPVVLTVVGADDAEWRCIVMPMRCVNEDKVNPWRDAFRDAKPDIAPPAEPEAKPPAKPEPQIAKAPKPRAKKKAKAPPRKKAKRGRR